MGSLRYNSALRWVLRHQWLTLGVAIGCAFLNVYLFKIVPKGFFPQQDTGRISGQTIASQDISFPAMEEKQKQLAQMTLNDPAIDTVTAFAGGGRGSNNTGFMFVGLKPLNERPGRVSADQVVNRLRGKLSSVPGARLFLQANQDIQLGGRGSAAQYQYTLSDPDIDELNTWAPRLEARARAMPELRDVSTDEQNQGLSETLVINRDIAARLGITTAAIDQVLYDAFGQRQVSTMYTGLNQYFVVMEVDPQYQLSPDFAQQHLHQDRLNRRARICAKPRLYNRTGDRHHCCCALGVGFAKRLRSLAGNFRDRWRSTCYHQHNFSFPCDSDLLEHQLRGGQYRCRRRFQRGIGQCSGDSIRHSLRKWRRALGLDCGTRCRNCQQRFHGYNH